MSGQAGSGQAGSGQAGTGQARDAAGEFPMLRLSVAVVMASGLWLVFVGSVSTDEVVVGLGATAGSIAFYILLERCRPSAVRLRVRDLLQGWRLSGYIFADSFLVTKALVRDVCGGPRVGSLYRAVRFEHEDGSPERMGRGVLATAYLTAAPNTIVLGIDPGSSLMVYHELKRSSAPEMAKQLGARP